MLATATSVRPSWPIAAAGCVLFIASVPGGRFDGEVAGGAGANSVDPETLREPMAGFAAGTDPGGFALALVEVRSTFFSRPPTASDSVVEGALCRSTRATEICASAAPLRHGCCLFEV